MHHAKLYSKPFCPPLHLQKAKALGIQQLCPCADKLTHESAAAAIAEGFSLRAWALKNDQVSSPFLIITSQIPKNAMCAFSLQLLQHCVACGVKGGTMDDPTRIFEALPAQASNCQHAL